jgi:hypothetical protein
MNREGARMSTVAASRRHPWCGLVWYGLDVRTGGGDGRFMTEPSLPSAPPGWYRLARQVGGPHFLAAVHYYRDSLGGLLSIPDVDSPCGRIKTGAIVHFETGEMRANACKLCQRALARG